MAESTKARPTATSRPRSEWLDRPAAGYKVDDQNYHRDNQEQVNQAATNVPNQAQQPKHQQNHYYRPKHDRSLLC
jgi:hypothetical protein